MADTQKERKRLEAESRALSALASQYEEEAGLGRPIAETVGDVVTRDPEDTEFASVLSDREVSENLVQLLEQNREQVDHALERLNQGTYGVCEDCGKQIPAERLRFRPEATRCVDCQARHDRTNVAPA